MRNHFPKSSGKGTLTDVGLLRDQDKFKHDSCVSLVSVMGLILFLLYIEDWYKMPWSVKNSPQSCELFGKD